jgi:hypothetical protein
MVRAIEWENDPLPVPSKECEQSSDMNNTLQLPGDLPDSIILEPGFRSRYAEMNEISAM